MDNRQIRKKLRGYLKSYRGWQRQAKEIERSLAAGEVPDSLRALLSTAHDEFVTKCYNVQIILSHTKSDGLEHQIMSALYVDGKPMKQIARELGYSCGYCANIELKSIKRLSLNGVIVQLLSN